MASDFDLAASAATRKSVTNDTIYEVDWILCDSPGITVKTKPTTKFFLLFGVNLVEI